jgi:hypothetical protein
MSVVVDVLAVVVSIVVVVGMLVILCSLVVGVLVVEVAVLAGMITRLFNKCTASVAADITELSNVDNSICSVLSK